MAAAKSTPAPKPTEETPEETNAAVVAPREYAAGYGWDVGQKAPTDAFRALDTGDLATPAGPVVYEHPGGYARQIVAKGGLVTEGVKRELDAADKADADEASNDESAGA